jgi:hypothetical protein
MLSLAGALAPSQSRHDGSSGSAQVALSNVDRTEIEILPHSRHSAPIWPLLAGVFTGLFGAVCIAVSSTPTLSAASAEARADTERGSATIRSARPVAQQENAAELPGATPSHRPNRARCTECGVIQALRQIRPPGKGGVQPVFEVTVRFRDGSTMVYSEATARTWRVGSQVIVLPGIDAPR